MAPSFGMGRGAVSSSGLDLGHLPVRRALFERAARLAPSVGGHADLVAVRFPPGERRPGSVLRWRAQGAGQGSRLGDDGVGRGHTLGPRADVRIDGPRAVARAASAVAGLGCCLAVLQSTRTAPRRKRLGACCAPAGSWSGGVPPTGREGVQGVRVGAARPRSGLVSLSAANSRAVRRAPSGPPSASDGRAQAAPAGRPSRLAARRPGCRPGDPVQARRPGSPDWHSDAGYTQPICTMHRSYALPLRTPGPRAAASSTVQTSQFEVPRVRASPASRSRTQRPR